MLIYIAGFTGVPADVIEAARIDGCTEGQVTRHIRLPLMMGSFVICFFLSFTRGFMVYDLNLSLTEGGPFNSTKMIAMHIYQQAFTSYKYGEGQAEAVVIFIITAIIAGIQVWAGKKREVEG